MNKLYALTGPPGSGKTAIAKKLQDYGIMTLVSHTTRAPKQGEQHGVDYFFVSKQEFLNLKLLETVSYSGSFYGLSKNEVLNKINANRTSVVDVDLQGLKQLKKLLGERVESIFVLTDKYTILSRLTLEGKELEEIKQRIEYAEKNGEFNNWQIADYVVKNTGSLDVAVRQVLAIMGFVVPAPHLI